jgi:Mg-chelatase subunit ChlD
MADSVIHSAVMAGILASLPSIRVKLVVFDTSVVDLSDHADDAVEALMSVQLGGGTDIARAVRYCQQLVENPQRTILALVTDFCEGGSPAELVGVCKGLAEARVKLLGLASLDSRAEPIYDKAMAGRLAAIGMQIAAMTPQRLAQWLVKVIS